MLPLSSSCRIYPLSFLLLLRGGFFSFSMELSHQPHAPTSRFPAAVIPSHRAICFSPLANGERKKANNHSKSVFNFSEFSFRTASRLTSPLRASDGRSILVAQEPETQFKSSFDDYLRAMESVRNRREGIKERKEENHARIGKNGDGGTESSVSIRTRNGERREKKGSSRTRIGSSGDGNRGGLRDSVRVEGEKAKYGRAGESNVKLKKFDGSKMNGSKFASRSPKEDATELVESVNLRLQEKRGSRFDKVTGVSSGKITKNKGEDLNSRDKFELVRTGRDGLFADEPFEDGVRGGRRITRMEMEGRIQKLAKCLNGADIDMPEWMFSKMMRSAQIRFSDHSILRVIQILGKLGNWRRVLQVIEWLQMRERYKSNTLRYVYTAALDALGRAKRPVEALNLFRTMQQQKGTYPDLVAYHCIAVTLGQAGHMKELFDVMDSMRSVPKNFKSGALVKLDPRLEPDIVVYNAILNGCVRRKQWEGAFWVLQQLRQAGIKPSSTTYGLVMEVMLACGKYNLVHEFFEKMQRSSIPNALSYKVVVNALWREGRIDEAIDAVQDMEKRGIVGSASLYYDLARCLCSAGRCQEALVRVDKMCKVASKPLVVTYTGLIQACLNAGRVEDGAYIFNHMHKYCSPNLATCNILLKAFLERGMLSEAKDLFQKMLQNERSADSARGGGTVTPDIYTFNTMLEALAERENWDDFENVYDQMLNHGHHYNTKRHLWMVMKASRAGKVGAVETTWNHLIQEGRVPPPALVKERFLLKLQDNHLRAALSTVTSHPSTHQQAFSKEAWLELLRRSAPSVGTGLVHRLMHELDSYLSSGESPNLVLSNLLESCREVVGNGLNDDPTKSVGPGLVFPSLTT